MKASEVKKKRKEIEGKIATHEAAIGVLIAEMEGIQKVCEHPKLRSWTHRDYGGDVDLHEVCDTCGYHKIS